MNAICGLDSAASPADIESMVVRDTCSCAVVSSPLDWLVPGTLRRTRVQFLNNIVFMLTFYEHNDEAK